MTNITFLTPSYRKVRMKNLFLSVLLFVAASASAQVSVIDPAGDGGFENGATFAANGWTVVNPTAATRNWYVGTGMTGFTGTASAFIGDDATTVATGAQSRTVHFYRSISIPAGAENIQLTFKYKQPLADAATGTIDDYVVVRVNTTAPVSGTMPTGTPVFGPYPAADLIDFTQQTATLPNSIAGTTTNLIFTFKGDTGTPHGAGAVDDISLTYIMPTCTAVTGLSVGTTATSATLSWAAASVTPDGYEYAVTTANTAPATGTTTSALSGTVTSLTANTTYYAWARKVCSATDTSSWVMMAFTTPCVAVDVPYAQNFETAIIPAMPECTIAINSGSGNTWVTATASTGGFTSKTLRYTYATTSPANTWFFTRAINLQAGTSYRISYKYGATSSSWAEKLKVAYGTENTAAAMTNVLADHPNVTGTTPTVATFDFVPTTSGVHYFGFQAYSATNQNLLLVDDILIDITPACQVPTAVTASSITSSTATVSWTASPSTTVAGYEYVVSSTNTAPAAAGTNVSSTTVNVSNLTADTQYYVWIRSDCATSGFSDWTAVYTFRTLCDAVNIPYSEDFESVTTPAFPSCTLVTTTGPANSWATASVNAGGFTNKALRYSYTYNGAANTWFFTRGVNLVAGTSYRVAYKYGASSTTYVEKLKVAYGTAAEAAAMNITLADHPTVTGSTPTYAEVDFTPASSGVYYFGFQAYSASGQNYLYLDEIAVDVSPTCVKPSAVTLVNVGENNANISWTAPASAPADGYQYFYSLTNTTPAANAAFQGSTAAGVVSANITGLAAATTYYVWVRSNCGNGDLSAWSQPALVVNTNCTAFNAPFAQTFDNGVMPDCWTTTSSNPVANGLWKFAGAVDYDPGNTRPVGTFAWVDGSEPSNMNNVTLTMPNVNLAGVTSPALIFEYFSNNDQPLNTNNTFKVEIFNGTTWTNLYTNATSEADWRTINIPLADYAGTTIQVRFIVDKTTAPVGSAFYNDILLDNVRIETTLATIDVDQKQFTFYPNPVSDVLNLSYANDITSVSVYNMLGQKVLVKQVNASQTTIDMSQLTSGAYILNVVAGDAVKTIKVIKK